MLSELHIKNFKVWSDTKQIRLAPITLFFGSNSSGKSSIGQLLLLLKQTSESQDRNAVFYPGGRTSAVQLNSYKDMVFARETNNSIWFSYRWNLPKPLDVKDTSAEKKLVYEIDEIKFTAEVSSSSEEHKLKVTILEYDLYKNKEKCFNVSMKPKISKNSSEYQVAAEGYNLKRRIGRVWPIKSPVRFYGFPDEVFAYFQNAEFAIDLNFLQEQLFRSISYLGPMRTKASRIYTWSGIQPENVGNEGENTVAAILSSTNRRISLGAKRPNRPLGQIVASKLKEMDLIDDFEVKAISEDRQEYEVKIKTKGSGFLVDLPDVGFGISQVLPVIVQCYYAKHNSIILMEQPEIHLHPSAQSALADVFIDTIKSKEDFLDRNIQLIVETHSEHLLRRLQRRIAEGEVPKEDVAVYFVNSSKFPASLVPLEIDIFGNISNWPENFFGDEIGDITAQAEAALKRRIILRDEAKKLDSNEKE